MTSRHNPGSAPVLTEKEWELILAALDACQHHAVYRALREKIAPVAKTAGVSLLAGAAAAPLALEGDGRSRLDFAG